MNTEESQSLLNSNAEAPNLPLCGLLLGFEVGMSDNAEGKGQCTEVQGTPL